MQRLRIVGGNPLRGVIRISGSKNAALPLSILSLLTEEPLILRGIPNLTDVRTLFDLLGHLGVSIEDCGDGRHVLRSRPALCSTIAPRSIVSRMRASFWVLGPLLAIHRRAKVSLPGGCAIGARPVDIYVKGLRAMGIEIDHQDGYIVAEGRPRGCTFRLDHPSVGATHVMVMAACLASGTSVLENVAREPEVVEVIECLNAMGARIYGAGSATVTVEGVSSLHGTMRTVVPDRIEACTYIMAGAITHGDVVIDNAPLSTIEIPIGLFKRANIGIDVLSETRLRASTCGGLEAVDVTTEAYPGFPTDLQAQFTALMMMARGQSRITERIFENRFSHVSELARFGADIHLNGESVLVRGAKRLSGARVTASDLRASAALVLAGLAARGETIIEHIHHLQRGFESLDQKLRQCGADIEVLCN